MNCARAGIWLAVALCVLAVPVKADHETGPLARIEALTAEQVSDVMISFLISKAENCRVELLRKDNDIFRGEVFEAFFVQLNIPKQHHAELAPALEGKLYRIDGSSVIVGKTLGMYFQLVREDEDRMVLLARDCQVLGA